MNLTRRQFLTRVGPAGSVSLAYETMMGLGLLAAPAQQTPFGSERSAADRQRLALEQSAHPFMQGAFDSARQVATTIHKRAPTRS